MKTVNKNQGGRPPLTMTRIRKKVTLTLYEGIDDDLIDWFDQIPKGEIANSIKTALRQGGMTLEQEDENVEDLISNDAFADFLDGI